MAQLIAEKFNNNTIHLIRVESGDVFSFPSNSIPFKALKEVGISRKEIRDAIKNISKEI